MNTRFRYVWGGLLALAVGGCQGSDSPATSDTAAPPPIANVGQSGNQVLTEWNLQGTASGGGFAQMYGEGIQATWSGSVVKKVFAERGDEGKLLFVRVVLRNGMGTAVLGPEEFIERNGITVGVTNKLEITGQRLVRPSGLFIVASKVKKGSRTVELRDEYGRPLWY